MHGSVFFTGVFFFAVSILKHNFQGLVFLKKTPFKMLDFLY